jgi:hypothetical protein
MLGTLGRYVVSDAYIGPMSEKAAIPDIVVQVKLQVKQGKIEEVEEVDTEDDIETEDSEQEFMLSDEEDEDDF